MDCPACAKKVIDNFAALGAEAAAIQAANFTSFVTQEAAALLIAAQGTSDAFRDLYPDIANDKAKVQIALDESYKSCEWAKELRASRDHWNRNTAADTPESQDSPANVIALQTFGMRLREMRDEMVTVFRTLAEDALRAQGFEVPTT